jgi:hypothetical protein
MKTSPWRVEDISAGDHSFNISRLRFTSMKEQPSLLFEILKTGSETHAFINLIRFRFSEEIAKVTLKIEEQTFEENLPVLEGRMRLRLPKESTELITKALQAGKKVDILLDGFEETLDPEQFSDTFREFETERPFFQTLLKGSLK